MRKIILISTLLIIGCKNYNTIEVTFVKTNPQDTFPIRHNLFKLTNDDTVIFQNTVFQDIKVGEKIKFDSLPNGNYTFEYKDIIGTKHIQKVKLKNDETLSRKIVFDDLPIEKFIKNSPINLIKNGESYKIVHFGGCLAYMESFYKISKANNQFFIDSYIDKTRKLNNDEVSAIEQFEAELYALRNKGTCTSTGMINYCVIIGSKRDTIIDRTCNWNGYEIMMKRIHNGN